MLFANALGHDEMIFWLASRTTCSKARNEPLWSIRFPREIDLEHLDGISRISGVSVAALKHSLNGECFRIHQFRLGSDVPDIEYRLPLHYCPFCVEDDVIPHFRSRWTSPFSVVCLKHRVVHREMCWRCLTPLFEAYETRRIDQSEHPCECQEPAFSTLSAKRVRINDLGMLEEFLYGEGQVIPWCLPFRRQAWFHSVSKTQWDVFFRWLLPLAIKYWEAIRPKDREKIRYLKFRPKIEDASIEERCDWIRKLIVVLEMIEHDFETLARVFRNVIELPTRFSRLLRRNRIVVAFHFALDDAQTTDCQPDWDLCWYRAGWIPDWQL